MGRIVRWLLLLAAFGWGAVAEAGFTTGGKLWYMQFSDASVDSALAMGPKAEYTTGDFRVAGLYMLGHGKRAGGGIPYHDAELVAGLSLGIVDAGIGLRHMTWTFYEGGTGSDVRVFGPMVSMGAGAPLLPGTPLGWYANSSIMFLDLGNMDRHSPSGDSGEHCNIEGGVSYSMDRLHLTCGYRVKFFIQYDGPDNDLTQSGLTLAATYVF